MLLQSSKQIDDSHNRPSLSSGIPLIAKHCMNAMRRDQAPLNSDFSFKPRELSYMGKEERARHTASPLDWTSNDDKDFKLSFISPESSPHLQKREASSYSTRPEFIIEDSCFPKSSLLSDILQEDNDSSKQIHSWQSPEMIPSRAAKPHDFQAGRDCVMEYSLDDAEVHLLNRDLALGYPCLHLCPWNKSVFTLKSLSGLKHET